MLRPRALILNEYSTKTLHPISTTLIPLSPASRYRAYRDAARNILERFDKATTMSRALHAMKEMEELSYDETIAFLRSNRDSTYAM
jgi:hypothetical protein